MPRFFVVSDIHGFYDELMEALNKVGFDKNNKDHWLISCGDNFDRGKKPIEVYHFLKSLDRKILVRGNHEDLMLELGDRGHPRSYDISNGTYDTIMKFCPEELNTDPYEAINYSVNRVKSFINSMVNYFETKKYIFVHGFIPIAYPENNVYSLKESEYYRFNPDWRNADNESWAAARWFNGMKMVDTYGVKPDKIVVCGHYHTSYGWARRFNISEFGEDAIFSPYITSNLIAIDACTAYSHKVNVLVIEDDFLENSTP